MGNENLTTKTKTKENIAGRKNVLARSQDPQDRISLRESSPPAQPKALQPYSSSIQCPTRSCLRVVQDCLIHAIFGDVITKTCIVRYQVFTTWLPCDGCQLSGVTAIYSHKYTFNPRPTGGGGLFRAPPLVFLRYLLNRCRYHRQTCSTLSPNIFTHCVKILKSRVS